MLKPGIVLPWFDGTTDPPKPKMIVCVCPTRCWFMRINSRPIWPGSTLLRQIEHPKFLLHDSYLECGTYLDILEDEILDLFEREGIVGSLSKTALKSAIDRIKQQPTLRQAERDIIVANLTSALEV